MTVAAAIKICATLLYKSRVEENDVILWPKISTIDLIIRDCRPRRQGRTFLKCQYCTSCESLLTTRSLRSVVISFWNCPGFPKWSRSLSFLTNILCAFLDVMFLSRIQRWPEQFHEYKCATDMMCPETLHKVSKELESEISLLDSSVRSSFRRIGRKMSYGKENKMSLFPFGGTWCRNIPRDRASRNSHIRPRVNSGGFRVDTWWSLWVNTKMDCEYRRAACIAALLLFSLLSFFSWAWSWILLLSVLGQLRKQWQLVLISAD